MLTAADGVMYEGCSGVRVTRVKPLALTTVSVHSTIIPPPVSDPGFVFCMLSGRRLGWVGALTPLPRDDLPQAECPP